MNARIDPVHQEARPIVGRQTELAILAGALERLPTGSAQFVGVAGEPGIGKSRLLKELAREAARAGRLVLSARAAEFEAEAPFGVVVEALDDRIAALGPETLERLDPTCVGLLGEIFPALAGPDAQRGPALAAERYRLHRAVRALLEELGTPDGLVLILDDLHWADAASVELLCHLLRHPPRAPVLIALELVMALTSAMNPNSEPCP